MANKTLFCEKYILTVNDTHNKLVTTLHLGMKSSFNRILVMDIEPVFDISFDVETVLFSPFKGSHIINT